MRGKEQEISPDVLVWGYTQGFFPMADPDTGRIEWYSADPRAILPLDPFHVPARLRRTLKNAPYTYTRDQDFEAVMWGCAERESTWINAGLVRSYARLHGLGLAHSVEVWRDGSLVGGLYGVHLGGAFFGESMFHRESGASKAALVHLAEHLNAQGFRMLEIQMITPLTAQFGARPIRKPEYEPLLQEALALRCPW